MPKVQPKQSAFTIVELLVVIVVIGILAAITIVSYTGISNKAVASSIQSDLDNASKALKLFQVDNMAYPATISTNCSTNPTTATPPTNLCLKISSANNYVGYSANNSSTIQSFLLIAGNGTTNYQVTNTTSPTLLAQLQPGVTPGAVLELRASKANSGLTQGINSPLTTIWTDTSGNNNNGTLTNFGATTASGWAGAGTTGDPYRAVFDGVDDYVGFSHTPSVATPYTIEAWVSMSVLNRNQGILKMNSSAWGLPAFLVASNNRVLLYSGPNKYQYSGVISSGLLGTWIHIIGVVAGQSNTNRQVYINGALSIGYSADDTGTYYEPAASGWSIGPWGTDYTNSAIGLLRVYPFALSATQVQANYTAGTN